MALFNLTENLWEAEQRERYFEEVALFENKYGDHAAAAVVEQVASALFNLTENLWEAKERERYFEEVDRILAAHGERWMKDAEKLLQRLIAAYKVRKSQNGGA